MWLWIVSAMKTTEKNVVPITKNRRVWRFVMRTSNRVRRRSLGKAGADRTNRQTPILEKLLIAIHTA
jgi:uncharacterized protein YpbB